MCWDDIEDLRTLLIVFTFGVMMTIVCLLAIDMLCPTVASPHADHLTTVYGNDFIEEE